jgi:CDP-paratose 2-epimerase
MRVLVTGSSGLIGSEAVVHYCNLGYDVYGIDNNSRAEFFGAQGDTSWNTKRLIGKFANFKHFPVDIKNLQELKGVFVRKFDIIIHCAAQPSHDKAAEFPLIDFSTNATGTLNMLESTRLYSPDSIFIFLSTNKVYGDGPNYCDLVETDLRYDFSSEDYKKGISESFSIDQSLHSIFGASKVAADVMVQEYGRYFGLKTGVFRGGCLTGPSHSGVELHGFLSYLIKTIVAGKEYKVFGYKGKQVRDQIHAKDVMHAFDQFIADPRSGEVYNLGGEYRNSASVLESIYMIEKFSKIHANFSVETENRVGDHICYYSDMTKFRSHYPNYAPQYTLEEIIEEMVYSEKKRYEE